MREIDRDREWWPQPPTTTDRATRATAVAAKSDCSYRLVRPHVTPCCLVSLS